MRLSKFSKLNKAETESIDGVKVIVGKCLVFLSITNVINVDKERVRINKIIEKNDTEIKKINQKLSNEKFLSNAPTNVVNKQKDLLLKIEEVQKKMFSSLNKLKNVK